MKEFTNADVVALRDALALVRAAQAAQAVWGVRGVDNHRTDAVQANMTRPAMTAVLLAELAGPDALDYLAGMLARAEAAQAGG